MYIINKVFFVHNFIETDICYQNYFSVSCKIFSAIRNLKALLTENKIFPRCNLNDLITVLVYKI